MPSDKIEFQNMTQSPTRETLTSPNLSPSEADPMAFLNRMANDPVPGREPIQPPTQTLDPAQVSQQVAQQVQVSATLEPVKPVTPAPEKQVPFSSPPKAPDITPKFFEEHKDAPQTDKTSQEVLGDTEEGIEGESPSSENFKNLRKAHKEAKTQLKTIQTEKEELATKLKAYETGEAVPEVLKAKEEEITRLSRYEKLVNLKASKEYKEKYIAPIKSAAKQLGDIFIDYGVPKERVNEVVNQAINTGNRAELNRFLLDHLGNDELGASEAKQIINNIRDVQTKAQEAEKEPQTALETLAAENEAVNQAREKTRRDKIVTMAQNTWVEELDAIRTEGKLIELIHKEDDPEFNANFPDRLLPQAAREYGKLITELGHKGLTELPKELARAIARQVLLAHASGVAVETRNRALEHLDTMTTNLTRSHLHMRPQIGGGVPRSAGSGPAPKIPTPEEDAAAITSKILGGRQ